MSKTPPRRAIRFLGTLGILGMGCGLSAASTPLEAPLASLQHSVPMRGVAATEQPGAENSAHGNSDGWTMLLFGLGTAAYAMRRQQRSFESRHSLAI